MSRYKVIQKIKKDDSFKIDDINYGKVIAVLLYNEKSIYKIGMLFKSVFYEFLNKYVDNDSDALFIYSLSKADRTDYDKICENFLKISEFDELYIYEKFTLKNFLKSFLYAVKNFGKIKHVEYISIFEKILLSFYISKFQIYIKKFHFKNRYVLMTTFCDAHPIDNLYTQKFNRAEVTTSTLQHGQYRVQKQGYEKSDSEAYMNFSSKYLFSWGEKTNIEFKKAGIAEERLLLSGSLKKFSRISNFDSVKGHFGVVLSADIYDTSNIKMIQVANLFAKEFDMQYIVRMHPNTNIKKYLKYLEAQYCLYYDYFEENDKFSNKVEFSLIHMTGVYVELLASLMPHFVLLDQFTEEIFINELTSFEDFNNLRNKYLKFLSNEELYISFFENEYKKFNYSDSKEYYQQYILELKYGGENGFYK